MSRPTPLRPALNPPPEASLSLPILGVLVAAKIILHLPGLTRYGYFRDELYFLDCARHLDWGYVDCAPLVAVYAKIALLLGGSLPALRVLPLIAGAGMVALTVLLATPLRRELARPWIWLGAALALAIFLPNLLWQWQHGFPTLEDLRNVRLTGKNVELVHWN